MKRMELNTDTLQNAASAAVSSKAMASLSWAKLASVASIGLAFAAIVVMAMTNPATRKELVVALICTIISSLCGGIISSLCGGSIAVTYFGIQAWAFDIFGLMGLMGIAFACGLPGWITVRAAFIFVQKNEDKGIDFFIKSIKGWFQCRRSSDTT